MDKSEIFSGIDINFDNKIKIFKCNKCYNNVKYLKWKKILNQNISLCINCLDKIENETKFLFN